MGAAVELGGALLGAGMVMIFHEGEYLYGQGIVRFTLEHIIETRTEWGAEWVIMTGQEITHRGNWRPRRLQARVNALNKALTLLDVSPVQESYQDRVLRMFN